jgi:hypothetical protein
MWAMIALWHSGLDLLAIGSSTPVITKQGPRLAHLQRQIPNALHCKANRHYRKASLQNYKVNLLRSKLKLDTATGKLTLPVR